MQTAPLPIDAGFGLWLRVAARRLPPVVAVTVLAALVTGAAGAQPRAAFVSIEQSDEETRHADELLRVALERKLGIRLSPRPPLGYGQAIIKLSDWASQEDGPYIARVTPYVYVAAEMLGADFEILGTYVSKATDGTTYRSSFVVNRAAIESTVELGGKAPDLDDLLEFIRARSNAGEPARFVYHDRFSTSSYFLPSLYFRHHNVFSMTRQRGSLIAIDSRELETKSSSALVEKVADGSAADFAAVWDGTRVKFAGGGERAALAERVYFIELPTALPNDLLVCSRSLLQSRDGQQPIGSDPRRLFVAADRSPAPFPIRHGDFRYWTELEGGAQDALVGLRVLAGEQRTPVTVRIAGAAGVSDSYLRAARLAVRLAGTELVPYEDGFHQAEDYVWTLRRVREGYVTLTSKLQAFGIEQTFPISFQPAVDGAEEQDLAQRIGRILTSRLHRIRYVWPYETMKPLVIRDVPFSLAKGSQVAVQRITWTDPQRNGYSDFGSRRVPVEDADLFKFRLEPETFRLAMADERGTITIDPMSPVAYRVLLLRDEKPRAMFALFNGAFLLLLGLSAAGTVLALRQARRLGPPPAVASRLDAASGPAVTTPAVAAASVLAAAGPAAAR